MYYQKFIYFGQNTFTYCSWILVFLVHVNILYKIHRVYATISQTELNQELPKTTDKHAAEFVGSYSDLCEIYRLFIQQYSQRYPSP